LQCVYLIVEFVRHMIVGLLIWLMLFGGWIVRLLPFLNWNLHKLVMIWHKIFLLCCLIVN